MTLGFDNSTLIVYRRLTMKQKHQDQTTLADLCKALGHPTRIRILAELSKVGSCYCGDLTDMLPLAQSTVSQHLKILKNAGLIEDGFQGPNRCYCVNRQRIEKFKNLATAI